VLWLYLFKGQGHGRIHASLPEQGPVYSTIREWIAAFAYGAGLLLLPSLVSSLSALGLEFEAPAGQLPADLNRVSDPRKRQRLGQAVYFWHLAERLYAWVKNRQARLHFAADSLFAFVLHWLQSRGHPPRLFWHEALPNTPVRPF
jgi:hypothetical protein